MMKYVFRIFRKGNPRKAIRAILCTLSHWLQGLKWPSATALTMFREKTNSSFRERLPKPNLKGTRHFFHDLLLTLLNHHIQFTSSAFVLPRFTGCRLVTPFLLKRPEMRWIKKEPGGVHKQTKREIQRTKASSHASKLVVTSPSFNARRRCCSTSCRWLSQLRYFWSHSCQSAKWAVPRQTNIHWRRCFYQW